MTKMTTPDSYQYIKHSYLSYVMKGLLVYFTPLVLQVILQCIGYQSNIIGTLYAQNIGVNSTGTTPNASSILDLNTGNTFTSPNGKGLLPPNIALTSITDVVTVTSPAVSLLVYNTATAGTGITAVAPGYYYYNGSKWVALGGADWQTSGNLGTTAGTNFIGTNDAQDLVIKTNSSEQMRVASATNNVGIGTATPNASAKLDITSVTQGFAMPRMTTAQRLAIATPVDGLQVYDINLKDYYYCVGGVWDNARMGAGTVSYFANTTAPRGYLECNGQSVSVTTYPELFNAIQYTYGGAGATFNVPDLRGEFIRGADNGRGVDVGRVLGTAQAASTHIELGGAGGAGTINDWWSDSKLNAISDSPVTVTGPPSNGGRLVNPYVNNPSTVVLYTYTHRPRNVALMPCIKY